ncbi:MAG: LLM class flavin-dependent oxidoreductase, partial [Candidatus Bathyarchaeia archaeon]
MRFGLLSFVQAPLNESLLTQLDNVLEQVHVAKESGFDSIFVGQHYLSTPYQMLQSIPLLARIAAEAHNMRIGTSILLIPLLHPVDVAEQIATLDVIAGGKFVFGVGLGYRDIEYEAFGVSKKHSVSRFTEALVVIKSLWTEDSVTFHGRHFTLNNVTMTVKPLQKPHPPIWIAAN